MTNRLMKDGLNNQALARIAQGIAQVDNHFDANAFLHEASDGLDGLELKARVMHIIQALGQCVDSDFEKHAKNMCELPSVWDYGDKEDSLRGFAAWPVIDYFAEYGLDYPDASLNALEKLTPLFSAEFAIRPFIVHHFDITYPRLLQWCDHGQEHVRRLASEGTRPRLPWGVQLKKFIHDPEPVIPILECLRFDESDYVKRSVANNLNDMSKDHPDWVIKLMKKWKKNDNGKSDWIIKHAARSLVKQGHPDSFSLLGYTDNNQIAVKKFKIDKEVTVGKKLNFEFELVNQLNTTSNIVVDYKILFVKANGSLNGKVFKLKNVKLKPGEKVLFAKIHDFKLITTRKYYEGIHHLEVLVNGTTVAKNVLS